jgi:hypothetical protein
MVYKKIFIVDPSYMQSIKQLRDAPLSVSCMTYLYTCLYGRFEALRDEPRLWVVHALKRLSTCHVQDVFYFRNDFVIIRDVGRWVGFG